MSKLIVDGKEIFNLEFDEDGEAPQIEFCDYFSSLPAAEQIALLEIEGRAMEKDIKEWDDQRILKRFAVQDIIMGKWKEPSKAELEYWLDVMRIIVAVLRGRVTGDMIKDFVKNIRCQTFQGD